MLWEWKLSHETERRVSGTVSGHRSEENYFKPCKLPDPSITEWTKVFFDRWTANQWSTVMGFRVSLKKLDNVKKGQPFLQFFTNKAVMVKWPDWSNSSLKSTKDPAGNLLKGTWMTFSCEKKHFKMPEIQVFRHNLKKIFI